MPVVLFLFLVTPGVGLAPHDMCPLSTSILFASWKVGVLGDEQVDVFLGCCGCWFLGPLHQDLAKLVRQTNYDGHRRLPRMSWMLVPRPTAPRLGEPRAP